MCTSLDEFSPGCSWDKDEVYRKQVAKEVEAAGMWVEKFIDDKNWPTVEWGPKDLSGLCVVVPNKHVVRLLCVNCTHVAKHSVTTSSASFAIIVCRV